MLFLRVFFMVCLWLFFYYLFMWFLFNVCIRRKKEIFFGFFYEVISLIGFGFLLLWFYLILIIFFFGVLFFGIVIFGDELLTYEFGVGL